MDLTKWFADQLQASADGFAWGVDQVSRTHRDKQPPKGLGEWTVARHVFHLWYYEVTLALPSMKQWLGKSAPSPEGSEDNVWNHSEKKDVEELLNEFCKVRQKQIELLAKLDDHLWNEIRETVWGPKTLLWVVSKTYQHNAEHTSDVMRIGLFWDRFT